MRILKSQQWKIYVNNVQNVHCFFTMFFFLIFKAIRSLTDPMKAQIPIIAMTANAFEEDRKTALAGGMNGHIAKSIDIEKLKEILLSILK